MKIICVGLNHKTAAIEKRQQFSLNKEDKTLFLAQLTGSKFSEEATVVSTCNRLEVYSSSKDDNYPHDVIKMLCNLKNVELSSSLTLFYIHTGDDAVKHLFETTCGFDSLVLGETQIQNQIKTAMETIMANESSSKILKPLFQRALEVAKHIRTNFNLSGNVSTGSVAINKTAECFLGTLEGRTVLVVGSGQIGLLTIEQLISRGVSKIYVANRTFETASSIAKRYHNVEAVPLENIYQYLDTCDVVVSSTASPDYIFRKKDVAKALNTEKRRVFVDLAVPRDIDPDITTIPNTTCFCIDDLKEVVDANLENRRKEVGRAKEVIQTRVDEFKKILVAKEMSEIYQQIVGRKTEIVEMVVEKSLKKVAGAEAGLLKTVANQTANRILGQYLYSVMDICTSEELRLILLKLRDAIKSQN